MACGDNKQFSKMKNTKQEESKHGALTKLE